MEHAYNEDENRHLQCACHLKRMPPRRNRRAAIPERAPAAQQGLNTGTIAICLHGLDEALFTTSQYESLRALCRAIENSYSRRIRFRGHCEVSNKACPVIDYRSILSLDSQGYMSE